MPENCPNTFIRNKANLFNTIWTAGSICFIEQKSFNKPYPVHMFVLSKSVYLLTSLGKIWVLLHNKQCFAALLFYPGGWLYGMGYFCRWYRKSYITAAAPTEQHFAKWQHQSHITASNDSRVVSLLDVTFPHWERAFKKTFTCLCFSCMLC